MRNTIPLSVATFVIAMSVTACSSDSNHNQQPSSPEIQFSVVAPPTPRDISRPEITTSTIDNFLLNAFTDKKTFISDLKVTRTNDKWTYSPAYYWPATPVNFYAVSPTESQMTRPETSGVANNAFRAEYVNTGATDLLYSVAKDQTPTSATTPRAVQLNFRHALSRVAVKMKSSNSDIRIKIYSVELENIMTKGVFTFPDETTSASGAPSLDGTTAGMGKWSDWSVPGNASIYDNASGSDYLSSSATEFSNNEYSFALPQPLSEATTVGNTVNGSFIKVKCVIDNGTNPDIRLWPNSQTPAENKEGEYGIIRFSLRNAASPQSWQPGVGYIYNLDINKVPGLDMIDFTVTVDEINLYTGTDMKD